MKEKLKEADYRRIEEFLKDHREQYGDFVCKSILNTVKYGKLPELYYREWIRELLDELGMVPDDENIAVAFMNELEGVHSIQDKHIIEVGGGLFPNLAKRISLKQDRGTITVYDPRIDPRLESTERLKLKRELFTSDTLVGEADLLIGLMPCKGAEPLIDQAIKKKIDFMVWLCEGGEHGDYFDFYEDDSEWRCSMICQAKRGVTEQGMGRLVQKTLKKYSNDFPIIYNIKDKM